MSTAVLKDKALEDYYSALFQMYGSEGWKKLMEDFGRMQELRDSVAGLENEQQLWHRHGELSMVEYVLAHQAVVEQAYASLLAEQEDEDEVLPTGGVAKVVE